MLGEVERFLRRTGMLPSQFGRRALGDPRFVFDLRKGREPRAKTIYKVCSFMAAHA